MTTPFNFAADTALPPALAARMQRAADDRAARGLISADGQTHPNAECRAVYDAGHGCLSRDYLNAMHRRLTLGCGVSMPRESAPE